MQRLLISAAWALLAAAPALASSNAGRLPADWFVLPEDQASYDPKKLVDHEEHGGTSYDRGEDKVADSVDKIFHYTAASMEGSGGILGNGQRPANAPADWVPWHLGNLLMNLGVNAAGTAGLVTGIGEASAEIQWSRTADNKKKYGLVAPLASAAAAANETAPADLSMNEYSTPMQIESQVNRVTDAVMATGRIADKGALHDGLLRVATDLQEVMVNINAYNDSNWDISRFELDVDISGSGKVSTGWTFGAAVRLRFEWARANYSQPLPEPNDGNTDKREDLRKLLAGVAKDMDTVNHDVFHDTGFGLKTLRLGVGLYFAHNFAVVKGKLGITGFVYYAKSSFKANRGLERMTAGGPIILSDEVPLMDLQPKAEHMAYADAQGVRYDKVPGGDDAADRVVYYMTREKFKRGLQTATNMAAFFAKRAKKQKDEAGPHYGGFEIDQIKTDFALSLEGAIKIITLGGKVALELVLHT